MKQSPSSHAIGHGQTLDDTRSIELRDGTPVLLRPLRREDEPRLFDLYANCSRVTLYRRYHHVFKLTREHVRSLCSIDDDQEISIVAEVGSYELVGHCRLVFSPEKKSAEYAVLVTDEWQGKGLGSQMTDYCLELAKARGAKRITAVTTPDNVCMIEVFKKAGFTLDYLGVDGVIWAEKRSCRESTYQPP